MSGRSPPLYCTLTLIAMQGHQKNSKNKKNVVHLSSNTIVIIYCYIGCKDKATTWYSTPRVATLGQQYNVGEKLTVILYTYYIYRHAEAPNITTHENNSAIEPYNYNIRNLLVYSTIQCSTFVIILYDSKCHQTIPQYIMSCSMYVCIY